MVHNYKKNRTVPTLYLRLYSTLGVSAINIIGTHNVKSTIDFLILNILRSIKYTFAFRLLIPFLHP